MKLEPLASPRSVEAELAGAGLRPDEAAPLELYRAWPIWDGGLCALYRPEGGDLSGAWTLVTVVPGLPAKVRQGLARGSAVLVPALRSFAFPFPHDPRLPRLAALGYASEIEDSVSEHLPATGHLAVGYRSYKPLYRAMLEYRFGKRPREALFLKVQTRYGFRSTRRIYETLAQETADLREVARPLAYLSDHRAILWSGRAGESLRKRLRREEDDALEDAARALAGLHARDLDLERRHDRQRELQTVSAWVEAAGSCFAPERGELLEMYRTLSAARVALPPTRLGTAHRDFHDDQILVAKDGLKLLDLDTLATAEPELDLGNFLAHLELPATAASPALRSERFLEAYLATGRPLRSSVLAWYRASALLRIACVYSFRPGRDHRVPHLLERTATALDQLRLRQEVTA